MMNRQTALKMVNFLLALVFTLQAATGLMSSKLPYELFRPLHQYGGWALTGLVCVHLFLNWSWIKNSLLQKNR